MPTRHNSLIYDDSQVDMDAAAVAIVRAEGALIIGKTVRETRLLNFSSELTTRKLAHNRVRIDS